MWNPPKEARRPQKYSSLLVQRVCSSPSTRPVHLPQIVKLALLPLLLFETTLGMLLLFRRQLHSFSSLPHHLTILSPVVWAPPRPLQLRSLSPALLWHQPERLHQSSSHWKNSPSVENGQESLEKGPKEQDLEAGGKKNNCEVSFVPTSTRNISCVYLS